MEYVKWLDRPTLRRPVLVAAFAGWNDAAEAATTSVRYLHETWHAHPFASIEPEEFFDFSSTRPTVFLRDGQTREIAWTTAEFSVASCRCQDECGLQGTNPLKWRTFYRQVTTSLTRAGDMVLRSARARRRSALAAGFESQKATDSGSSTLWASAQSYEGPTACRSSRSVHHAGIASASVGRGTQLVAHDRRPKRRPSRVARARCSSCPLNNGPEIARPTRAAKYRACAARRRGHDDYVRASSHGRRSDPLRRRRRR